MHYTVIITNSMVNGGRKYKSKQFYCQLLWDLNIFTIHKKINKYTRQSTSTCAKHKESTKVTSNSIDVIQQQ